MKPLRPTPDPLHRNLQVWQVRPPADSAFRSGVWARIEALRGEAPASWATYLRPHALRWALTLVILAGGAAAIGQRAAALHERHEREAMVHTYLAAIDARLMNR